MFLSGHHGIFVVVLTFVTLLNAQLNPEDAPWTSWSIATPEDYQAIISTCHLDAYSTDVKRPDLLPQIYTEDAVASYTASQNLSIGIEAIREVHVNGVKGFISQHLLSNFLIDVADDGMSANATYFAIATLFTNPQQTPGQFVNLYGYYNDKLVKTSDGWRIKYHQYRFFGPGWAGNQTILPAEHPFAVPASFEPPGFDPNNPPRKF